ncbi:MAG TPA: PIN domain-containing protein, partial [Candidatus Nanoarchaeia archaeon]|nr:PIN domain-containing protein [Candidatus Nanoarchaeia archaeon]
MKLVVDANILFAALIKQGKTLELLLHPFFELYSSEFIFQEFEKHRDEILNKMHISKEDFSNVFEKIKKIIIFVKEEDLIAYMEEA